MNTPPPRFSILNYGSACFLSILLVMAFRSRLPAAPADLRMPPGLDTYCYAHDDLGAVYTPQATALKLWAPTAKSVSVILFDGPTSPTASTRSLTRSEEGVWTTTLDGDFNGRYYQYEITQAPKADQPAKVVRVNDPYARGCSANSGRTLIYDPAQTNPEGWDQDPFVSLPQNVDAVLYEAHVRDYTINPNAGVSAALRGKYLGLVEAGTKTPGGHTSGLDHLKELGITHVHLLPTYDYAAGDERQKAGQYNWYSWGYDPELYNTPEGSYASDPDGTARQKEFKQMVQAFHRQHIGVIVDMVFNHTAATGDQPASVFDKIFPGYYYRLDAAGHYANATGCGNELASEKPMVRKFIVDSVKYWMTEYHADGCRFDLMGILDRETMTQVYGKARRINPNAIIYGEGWQMEGVLPADKMMTQTHVQGTGIAAFNDGLRDNIKGDNAPRALGFVHGVPPPYGGRERFELQLKGQSTGKDSRSIEVATPNETINYDSVHDDLCLWDKLTLSDPDAPESVRADMDKLAAGILLTAQGVPFIHAGDEFLRSKNLNGNAYNDNRPNVNPIDWSLKDRHSEVAEYYRGLIALRKAHPAFRLADRKLVDQAIRFLPTDSPNVVAYTIDGRASGDSWRNLLIIYNSTRQTQEVLVPGHWTMVANAQKAGITPLESMTKKIRVTPVSLVVAFNDEGTK
jgi:pullulanase